MNPGSSVRALSSRPWVRLAGIGALGLLLSLAAWHPMLELYPNTQWGDGQFFEKMIEAGRVSVTRYHELPLWNPYECGGVPLWDNPQSPIAAPLLWIMPWVGTTRAIEIWYVVHTAIGFACMWLFARYELRLSGPSTFVAAAVWAFAGVHWHHTTGGGVNWVPFFYAPLMLLLWRRAEDDHRAAVGLGLVVAVMIHEGGVYPLAHALLLLGAETLTRAWPLRRLPHIATAGIIVIAVAMTVGATRFLPVIDQLRWHTRNLGAETDRMHWDTLKDIFLRRDHDRPVEGQQYVWTEYADYLGPFVLALATVGLLLSVGQDAWLVVLFVLAFSLMLGHFAKAAPWSILKGHVFPFKELRVPSRFAAWATVFLAAFSGIALDRLDSLARRRARDPSWPDAVWTALCGLAFIGVGDMISVQTDWCERFFHEPPSRAVPPSSRLYIGGAGLASFIDQPQQNRGRLDCWEEWAFSAGAPLWEGDLPQARAKDDGAVVHNVRRTQNTFAFDAEVSRPSLILLNSGYDRGWQTDIGTTAELSKQLVIALPAGRHQVHVRYWPRWMNAGLALFAVGIVGMLVYLAWLQRKAGGHPRVVQFKAPRPALGSGSRGVPFVRHTVGGTPRPYRTSPSGGLRSRWGCR
jgi:hypothetical protein